LKRSLLALNRNKKLSLFGVNTGHTTLNLGLEPKKLLTAVIDFS
jgi:hypothetical protein